MDVKPIKSTLDDWRGVSNGRRGACTD